MTVSGVQGVGAHDRVVLKDGWHLSVSDGDAYGDAGYARAFIDIAGRIEAAMVGPMPWFLTRVIGDDQRIVAKGQGVVSMGMQA